MKALVTGGGGFLGSAIVKCLQQDGYDVTSFSRSKHNSLDKLGIKQIQGDLGSDQGLSDIIRDVDVVFHSASLTGVWGDYQTYARTNITGVKNVVEACKKNNIKYLVYTSTPSVVFDRQAIEGGNESLPYPSPSSFLCNYAKTKAEAEAYLLAANSSSLKTVALRPHLIWGPGDPHLVPRIIERAKTGKLTKVGDGQNKVDITYVDDAAKAHLQAFQSLQKDDTCAGKPYFISQDEPVNLWDWIEDLLTRLNIEKPKKQISHKTAYVIGCAMEATYHLLRIKKEPLMTRFVADQLAKSHWFSIEQAKADFGFEPELTIEQGLGNTVDWAKQTGLV